ncbi:hypothetical protein PUN28_001348 [Cardiocondyla obscurior]|uniref:Uncharacterized protein n=1 Tax=Cardiocondyla obscurior TaxID=286306 RepID=A0AAW2H518_9HYME
MLMTVNCAHSLMKERFSADFYNLTQLFYLPKRSGAKNENFSTIYSFSSLHVSTSRREKEKLSNSAILLAIGQIASVCSVLAVKIA